MAGPTFWLAIGAIFIFAIALQALPAGGATTAGGAGGLADRLRHLALPTVVLAAVTTAELLRYMRSSARTAFQQPFVRVARAKGVPSGSIRRRHVLRTALLPVITALGIQLPAHHAAITETAA